uniref:Uncharacterized protein n=1 Tax=Myotis myotis TaxID=51298 RepID=A0A7J7VHS6_MYOMY|nr:hypothetical protein mMyoMyo1_008234 [Myotis myotis]
MTASVAVNSEPGRESEGAAQRAAAARAPRSRAVRGARRKGCVVAPRVWLSLPFSEIQGPNSRRKTAPGDLNPSSAQLYGSSASASSPVNWLPLKEVDRVILRPFQRKSQDPTYWAKLNPEIPPFNHRVCRPGSLRTGTSG